MNSLKLALKNHSVVYIARDLERALGLPKDYENYHSITNATPFAKQLIKSPESGVRSPKVLLIESDRLLDTHELLTHPTSIAFLKTLHNPQLLVFKNTTVIEKICREQGYTLLNPPARFSQMVEEKISQLAWLGELAELLPPHRVELLKDISFADVEGKILQVNRAHTGSGTLHLTDKQVFADLQTKFPNRPVRITDFVAGPMLTNNNVVWGTHVLSGPINYQITGLLPFTDRPFATIGNDWALPHTLLSPELMKNYQSIAQAVGKKLASQGWRGLFGIDVVLDEKQQKLYLIEINARQPASTSFESTLQQKSPQLQIPNSKFLTTFESHLSSLLNLPYEGQEIIPLTDGAQIIQRVREDHTAPLAAATASLTTAGFTVTPYTNTKPGEDLLRIQSPHGLMEKHGIFNEIGDVVSTELVPYPAELQKIALGFRADKHKLWALDRPLSIVPISEFDWELSLPFWEKEGTDDWNLTPQEVLNYPETQPTHYRRILEADLSFPLIIMRQHNRWRILDGLHRLCKAHLEKLTEVNVKIISEKDIPLIEKKLEKTP